MHVVIGSGPIGSTVARLLADEGERVRIITRSGTGPDHPAIERVVGDATDADRLIGLTRGADALYNCANPPYTRWPQMWPPIAAATLAAAETTGAVLAIMGNLYGYGPVSGSMHEDLPLAASTVKGRVRAKMWQDAQAAHAAGRVRATEVRASDYLGAGTRSMVTEFLLPKLLKGTSVRVPAELDAPHSFGYPGDAARTLVTVARDERGWGRAWHAPHDAPSSIREVARLASGFAGIPLPRLTRIPGWQLSLAARFSAELREFNEMSYQFTAPFVVDSSRVESTFGLKPTPLADAVRETVDALRV